MSLGDVTLAVIAKAPVAGRVKTRLCPPCTPEQAAALAQASLRDTLAAMDGVRDPRVRRAIVLEGAPGPWCGDATIVAQRGGAWLDQRLANGFADLGGGPTLIIGMDTPQVTAAQLEGAVAALASSDAVLGPAPDGGYWCIGLRRPDPRALLGVPMSVDHTLMAQRARLGGLGLSLAEVDELTDVDTIEDAETVAAAAPDTHFARALAELRIAA
jgi:uncharacterized protein